MPSNREIEQAFDSVESAQDFIALLTDVIGDSTADLQRDRERAGADGDDRRVQALDLTLYKLKQLGCHMQKSRRILNDLRTLRRLLMDERAMAAALAADETAREARAELERKTQAG
jgi:hypothetical protein